MIVHVNNDVRISVVVTCHSEGVLLENAIKSAENQSDKDFELLVVNDASTDEVTNRLCREFEKNKRARILWRENNGGLSAARNTGFESMSGNICVPLDGDDLLPPHCISTVRDSFSRNPTAGYIFGNYRRVSVEDGSEQLIECSELVSETGFMDPAKCLMNWILYGGSPCKRTTWEEVGGYDQDFSYGGQDVDFWLKVFRKKIPGWYVNENIYIWNRSANGMNAKRRRDPSNKLHIIEKNIDTFDAFGLGKVARTNLVKGHLLHGSDASAKRFARQLMSGGDRSSYALIVSILPIGFSKALYLLKRKMFTRSVPSY
jgi:glycosyltransferase involved in cell wall biosynthesis